jgi:hypothetical protein
MPPAIRGGRLLSTVTPAEVCGWQARCGLKTDAQAAHVLGLSVPSYRRKRTGRSKVTRQTALLMAYFEIYSDRWLALSEAAYRLAQLTRCPVAPPAARRAEATLTQIVTELDRAA